MKRFLLTLSLCSLVAAVVSCEYYSPDIRFEQTITNDYTEIVKALQDQTMSISKRLELLEDAMKSQTMTVSEKMNLLDAALKNLTMTLSQKMELLTKAYENGVLKYEEMTGKLVDEIRLMNATTTEKLEALKGAVEAQTSDLVTKLDLIEKALSLIAEKAEDGFDRNAEAIGLVKAAVNSLEGTIEEKLTAIRKAIRNQTVTLSGKLELIDATLKAGFADNAKAIGLVEDAIGSLEGTVETKLDAVKRAVNRQTKELGQKMNLIRAAVRNGLVKNAEAIDLVKQAVESLEGAMDEKLDAINKAVGDQTGALSEKLAAIEGAIQGGLVGEDSTLGLVKKAINALNATAGTANDKLDAIKDAIDSPMSGLNVKLDAIKEAVAKGLASVTEKQDLILAALNSESSHNFTEDELIEVGNDHLYVDAYFWKNHAQDDYEINKVLKKMLPLCFPGSFEFVYRKDGVDYPLSGNKEGSSFGRLYNKNSHPSIDPLDELILAVSLREDGKPNVSPLNGHDCYCLQKVYKDAWYDFGVAKGGMAKDKELKCIVPASKDDSFGRQNSTEIRYSVRLKAEKKDGVFGFRGLPTKNYILVFADK